MSQATAAAQQIPRNLQAWANAPFLTEHGEHTSYQGAVQALERSQFQPNPQHSVSSGVRRSPDLYDGQPVVMLLQRNGVLNLNYCTLAPEQAEALAALLLRSAAVCRLVAGAVGGQASEEAMRAQQRARYAAKYAAKAVAQGGVA